MHDAFNKMLKRLALLLLLFATPLVSPALVHAAQLSSSNKLSPHGSCNPMPTETLIGRPALAGFGSLLYLAWTGTDNRLNVISTNGTCWYSKYTSSQTSDLGPGIASCGGLLWIAWAGTNHLNGTTYEGYLNLMSSSDGVNWHQYPRLSDSSNTSPAIVCYQSQLMIAWGGTDAGITLNVESTTNGTSFSNKKTFSGVSTPYDPSISQFTPQAGDYAGKDILFLAELTGGGPIGDTGLPWDAVNTGVGASGWNTSTYDWAGPSQALASPGLSPGTRNNLVAAYADQGGSGRTFSAVYFENSVNGTFFASPNGDIAHSQMNDVPPALAKYNNTVFIAWQDRNTLPNQIRFTSISGV